jgi:hypothetical protein
MFHTSRFARGGFMLTLALLLSLFALPGSPVAAQGATLSVTPGSAPQNSVVTFDFNGFGNSEIVSLWLTLPDQSVISLGDVEVTDDGGGYLDVFIDSSFPVGVHYFSARGNSTGVLAKARFELTVGRGAGNSAGVRITVDSESLPQGECFVYSGTGYTGGETLGVWITRPDGSVSDLGEIEAASDGSFEDSICYGSLAREGKYSYTAYGKDSGRTGIAEFVLKRGDYLGAPAGGATLAVEPASAKQLDIVTLIGDGFEAGELISLWVTLPDGRVLTLFEGYTTDGSFAEDIYLPPLPVGRHYFSAYGNSSGLRAVAAFDLLPGDGE